MKIPATFAILIILCLHGEIATHVSKAPKSPEVSVEASNSSKKDVNAHNVSISSDNSTLKTTIDTHGTNTSVVTEITPVITDVPATNLYTTNPTPSSNLTTLSPSNTTTTPSPPTTAPTTPTPPTTSSAPTTSPSPTTPTSTAPTTTSSKPSTTKVPEPTPNVTSTTPVAPTTVAPEVSTPAPHNKNRFDGPSFIGGIVLSLGLVAIGFIGWKYYKARTERNYRTL